MGPRASAGEMSQDIIREYSWELAERQAKQRLSEHSSRPPIPKAVCLGRSRLPVFNF